jgi:excisionase family DNA binding protein
VNLADAIRKAANRGVIDVSPEAFATGNEPFAWPEEPTMNQQTSTPKPTAPEAPAVQFGNAIRLEIFLSGEQMAGMLKAIMAGQHSVLTLREAASYLRISPRTLEKLVEDGEIPAVEIDGRYRFPKSNLDDWLANTSAEHEEEKDVA